VADHKTSTQEVIPEENEKPLSKSALNTNNMKYTRNQD